MYSLFNELVGKRCEINTTDSYYEGTLLRFQQNVAVIYDESEGKEVYINLLHFISICRCEEDEEDIKIKKKGLFGRKNNMEEL